MYFNSVQHFKLLETFSSTHPVRYEVIITFILGCDIMVRICWCYNDCLYRRCVGLYVCVHVCANVCKEGLVLVPKHTYVTRTICNPTNMFNLRSFIDLIV